MIDDFRGGVLCCCVVYCMGEGGFHRERKDSCIGLGLDKETCACAAAVHVRKVNQRQRLGLVAEEIVAPPPHPRQHVPATVIHHDHATTGHLVVDGLKRIYDLQGASRGGSGGGGGGTPCQPNGADGLPRSHPPRPPPPCRCLCVWAGARALSHRAIKVAVQERKRDRGWILVGRQFRKPPGMNHRQLEPKRCEHLLEP